VVSALRGLGKAGRRWLLLGHRWLGITTALLFAVWIGSGLVMLYVPFPTQTPAERLARLAPMAWDHVRIGPDAALAAAGLSDTPAAASLEMRGGSPVYQFSAADGARRTVSAATGARLESVDEDEARRIAGGGRSESLWRDQWTVAGRYDPLRPFFKVALGDEAGTERYVSAVTGEVALDTTRWQRGWNWVGAVTHWVYLTPLRAQPEVWRQVVLWLSGVACVTALTGVTAGLWRLRLRHRYRGKAVSPYRGLALWHHGFGLVGGLGLVSFIVSGWLSMNPNRWFSAQNPPAAVQATYAGQPGPFGFDAGALAEMGGPALRAIRFVPIGGHWWMIRDTAEGPQAVAEAHSPDEREAAYVAAATGAIAGGRLSAVRRLSAYDAYWYPSGDPRPLPVLRLIFDDPAATWLHIDPRDGTILNRLDRSGRVNRWLFAGLHRLDWPGLTLRPVGREVSQWVLNLLAAGVAGSGLVLGWRRLRARTAR
jgi:hypothetical protein